MPRRWPRARTTAFLQCPVATSQRAKTRQKKLLTQDSFFLKNIFQIRRRPRVRRRWAPARITAYLQCPVRRRESLHIYSVGGQTSTDSFVNMQSPCLASWRLFPRACFFMSPFLGGPLVLATAPGKSFEKQRVPPRCPPARIIAYLQCTVTTWMGGETCSNKKLLT